VPDFLDYLDVVAEVETLIEDLNLDGVCVCVYVCVCVCVFLSLSLSLARARARSLSLSLEDHELKTRRAPA